MATKKTYLLPENPSPENDKCMIVWYPDDPQFQRALLGSLVHLEKWVAWDRDEAHTALVVSQRMKQANQRTLSTLESIDCEFLDQLTEDGDMSITVNNNVDCGGCGSCDSCQPPSPNTVYSPNPNQPTNQQAEDIANAPNTTDDGVNPPDGFDTYAEFLAYKCRAARSLAYDISDALSNMSTYSGLLGALGALGAGALLTSATVGGLITGVLGAGLISAGAIWLLVGVFAALVIIGPALMVYFQQVSTEAELRLDEITCALYTASSVAEARQNIQDIFGDIVGGIVYDDAFSEGFFSKSILQIIDVLLPDDIVGLLYNFVESVDEFLENRDNFDCGQCVEAIEGFTLLNAEYLSHTTGNGGVLEVLANGWELTGSDNAFADVQSDFTVFANTWQSVRGWELTLVSKNAATFQAAIQASGGVTIHQCTVQDIPVGTVIRGRRQNEVDASVIAWAGAGDVECVLRDTSESKVRLINWGTVTNGPAEFVALVKWLVVTADIL